MDDLIARSRHPKVVAIGKCGLDYYYEHSPRAKQVKNFRAHIAASRQTGDQFFWPVSAFQASDRAE